MQNRRGQESFQDTSTFFYDVLSFIPLLLCTSNFSSTCNPVLAGYKRGEGIVRGGEKSSLKRKSFVDEDFLYGHMSCPRSTSRPLEKILLDFLGKRRRRNRVEEIVFRLTIIVMHVLLHSWIACLGKMRNARTNGIRCRILDLSSCNTNEND